MSIESDDVESAGPIAAVTAHATSPAATATSGSWSVRGTVRTSEGSAAAGVSMQLLARRLRGGDVVLGKAQTGVDGSYAISYRPSTARLDLVVTATSGAASASSSVIVGAGPDEIVDLVLGGAYLGPSDFAITQQAVQAVLSSETSTTTIADLGETDLALLAVKSGVEPAELVLLHQSAALAATTHLSEQLFYALGRQHIALSFAAIATTPPQRRRDAVARALTANQIPSSAANALQSDLAKLDDLLIAEALRDPKTPTESTLGSLLGAAGLAADKRAMLVALNIKSAGDTASFWKSVRDSATLTAAEIEQLQNTLRLAALCFGHVPLVQALLAKKLSTPSDLAPLETADWQALVAISGMPPDLTAAGLATDDYVARLAAAVENAVPTARVAARASHLPGATALTQFFANNPEYDFRASAVAAFLRAKPAALAFLPTDDARHTFTQQLKSIDRIFRIAPPGTRLPAMELLLADGIDSAQTIRAMGRTAFLRQYAARLGTDAAGQLWARASLAAATATMLVARHGAAFAGAPIRALPARTTALTQLPDYATLFGSADACSCGECLSLYSPSAYLSDTLHWLAGRASTGAGSALDVLLDPTRRGDIGNIELSCPNTSTTLPQIDLAIELLELAVAPPATPPAYQTRGTSDDLRVQPEHQHDPAYTVLAGADPTRDAVYPFRLPYNLWLDEARTYLGPLGLSRAELMTALHEGGPAAAVVDPSVAAESLGMSPLEWDVIANKPLTPTRTPAAFWGATNDPLWPTTLSTVSTFLARAIPEATRDVAYAALSDWLRTDFVQAAGDLGLWFAGASCDTTQATLVGLTPSHLDRLHRFARLQRRLGWSAADLDRAITVLGGGTLDESLLIKVAVVCQIRTALDPISNTELLTWWGPLDTRRWSGRLVAGRPPGIAPAEVGAGLVFSRVLAPVASDGDDQSFFDARFLTRSVGAAPDSAFSISTDGAQLLDETQALADHAPAVAAALGISAADLGALTSSLPSDRLTLASLSQLFRQVSLARAIGMGISEASKLLSLAGDASSPQHAYDIVAEARATRAASLSLDEVNFLLRDVDTQPPTLAPTDTAIGVILLAMRDALRRAQLDTADPATQHQSARSVVIDKLSAGLGLDAAIVAPLLDVHLRSPLDNTTAALAVFLDPALTAYQGVDPETGAPVPPTPTDLPAAFATFRRLSQTALLVARLQLGPDELSWVCATGPRTGSLDPNSLPVSSSAPAASYAAWARLRDAVSLRNGVLGRHLFDVFDRAASVQATADPAQIALGHAALLDALAQRTRWTRSDIESLVGIPAQNGQPAVPGALGLTYPTDWIDERGFSRLTKAMTAINRIGLAADTVAPWREIPASIDVQQLQAQAIRQALRARHSEEQWRSIAGPLRDSLRERQRDALVGWLCAPDSPLSTVDDLYGHLLIDVLVSPCQITSRIRQAMSSVQQFVQRALLGLESSIALSVGDAAEWTWRKTYRVWEANRKVFLYPENWIDPSLRDDKTPLFTALEQALAQSDLTAAAAEQALLDYLHRLDELARLEVVASLHEHDGAGDVLHVFARTRNTPPTYYYRQRTAGVRWTPWQAIDVDVEGDHLVPVIFQGRLYLFWAQFGEAALEVVPDVPSGPGAIAGSSPNRYYQIRLAWSQYRDGQWLGRKLSDVQVAPTGAVDESLQCLIKTSASTPADFFFRTYVNANDDLVIEPVRQFNGSYYYAPQFRMSGCDGSMTLDASDERATLVVRLPQGTKTEGQAYASLTPDAALWIPDRNPSTSAYEEWPGLGKTDGAFTVVPPQVDAVLGDDVFFFQDRQRTFAVAPETRRWSRLPPAWLDTDDVALETIHLYAEVERPAVPRPDPWLLDPRSVARLSGTVRLSSQPSLLASSGTPLAGLLSADTRAFADYLGGRVAYVGGETVTARPSSVALVGQTTILSSTGNVLVSTRSPGAPAAASALRTLTLDQSHRLPPIEVSDPGAGSVLTPLTGQRYRFEGFHHPYVCRMLRQVQLFGVDGLLDPSPLGPEPLLRRQRLSATYFPAGYAPTTVDAPFPVDEIDFSYRGAYSAYNWEVFFHIPFSIACRLSANQQFADAQRWFHYIFDPTESSRDLPVQQRCWKFRPFYELYNGENAEVGPIADLLLLLEYAGTDPAKLSARDDLLAQIAAWRAEPFTPDAIARLRVVAYAKAVVVKYIDNLIAWGDHLFAQDTRETVDEATQLYVLASQILGPHPANIAIAPPPPRTFEQLRALGLDAFGDAMATEVEGYLPDVGALPDNDSDSSTPAPCASSLYFCVPQNDQLVADTWDRVADRLFKIRHCLDISGRPQNLPLFEPPIDPGLLVRAASAGVDLASALRDITAPQPIHRFVVLVQKANELCSEVRGLGQTMLATLEKQDAEALALLRSDQETRLFSAMRQVRQQQVDDASATLAGLQSAREAAEVRVRYYRSREFMNPNEILHTTLSTAAAVLDSAAVVALMVGSVVSQAPDAEIGVAGFGGSPLSTARYGGTQAHNTAQSTADHLETAARLSDRAAAVASIIGGYQRRQDDWQLQGDLAEQDRNALDKQILSAQIRVAIAQHELSNLDLQISQARAVEDQLRTKYTNQELYTWMVGQLASIYFQGYQLAYAVAKRAERAWQFELAQPTQSFIQFGYWDSLKKGLLAGERLSYDLRRMEVAYLDQNRREYELTAHVSLRLLDPAALEKLRTDGECFVQVPEFWYDLDTPGHYLRRLKSVAISVPCVTGPYVPVRCTLTLLSSSVRTSADTSGAYPRTGSSDPRFRDDALGLQSIVTSRAQEDAGLFETSLRDERYLPFEGAGAVGQWHLELPRQFRQFDYGTISDVVLHLRYTARDGGDALRTQAEGALLPMLQGLAQGISLREEMPDLLYQLLHPAPDATGQAIALSLTKDRFPWLVQGNTITIAGVDVFLAVADLAGYKTGTPVRLELTSPGATAEVVDLTSGADYGGVPHGSLDLTPARPTGEWSLAFVEAENTGASSSVVTSVDGHRRLAPGAIRDIVLVVRYRAS